MANLVSSRKTLSSRIEGLLLRVFTFIALAVITFFILLSFGLRRELAQYTCDSLRRPIQLASYQIGREIALKNDVIAKELVDAFKSELDSGAPNKGISLELKRGNGKLPTHWNCEKGFNRITFVSPVSFGDQVVGSLNGSFRMFEVGSVALQLGAFLAIILAVLILLARKIYWFFNREVVYPLHEIATANFQFAGTELAPEIEKITKDLKQSHDNLIESERLKLEVSADMKIADIAAQVSHDIRSPLSALNMVIAGLSNIEEERRSILRGAVQRINDITNNLLSENRKRRDGVDVTNFVEPEEVVRTPIMVSSILESIISEKRAEFRSNLGIVIQAELTESYGNFININQTEFSRMISNLLNNAVESLRGGGIVKVTLSKLDEKVQIIIEDTGCGIPPDVIHNLGKKGFSFGKIGESSGSGLGLYHAYQTVSKAEGVIEIQSTVNVGTRLMITFPAANAPYWFIDSLAIPKGCTLVTIDDEKTIHQVWSQRFFIEIPSEHEIVHRSFINVKEFSEWFIENDHDNMLFLVDFEFAGQVGDGLDLILGMGISNRAILITSRNEDPNVSHRATQLGVKIIPKCMSPFVPLSLGTEN